MHHIHWMISYDFHRFVHIPKWKPWIYEQCHKNMHKIGYRTSIAAESSQWIMFQCCVWSNWLRRSRSLPQYAKYATQSMHCIVLHWAVYELVVIWCLNQYLFQLTIAMAHNASRSIEYAFKLNSISFDPVAEFWVTQLSIPNSKFSVFWMLVFANAFGISRFNRENEKNNIQQWKNHEWKITRMFSIFIIYRNQCHYFMCHEYLLHINKYLQ